MRVFCFYGSAEERDRQRLDLRKSPASFDTILTTFETVIKEKNELKRLDFEYLIMDEA